MRTGLVTMAAVVIMAAVCRGADAPGAKVLPAFGLSVVAPAGWQEQTPEMLNEVISWTQPAQEGRKVQGAITVRCEPAKGNLEANAAEIALRYGGAVLDEKATMDGEPAKVVWISREGVNAELRAVVAQHAGLAYLVECTGPAGGLARAQLDEVVKNLKWSKLQDITDNLKADGPWMAALAGTLSIQRPEVMRPAAPPEAQKADRFLLMTPRARGSDAEFICVVGLGPALDSRPFAEMAASYLAAVNAQDPKANVQWQNADGKKRLSNLATLIKTDPTGTPRPVHEIVGIAQIAGVERYVVVNFLVNTEDPAKRKTYEGVAKRIFDSFKPAGK